MHGGKGIRETSNLGQSLSDSIDDTVFALHWECKNSPSHDFTVKNRGDDSGKSRSVVRSDADRE